MKKDYKPVKVSIGDVFYCSWGYSMTLVNFYKVVKVSPQSLVLHEIGLKTVDNSDGFAGRCAPDVTVDNSTRDDGIVRVFNRTIDDYITFKSSLTGFSKFFHPYNGKPVYFNHCD